MATLLVKHTVEDFMKWKKAFDEHSGMRKVSGSKGGKVFQAEGNPNEVTVVLHWDTLENAKKFASSPDLKTAMQSAGVTGQPRIEFMDTESSVNV
jgi:heme-degrading monooxygenase HmoA